MKKNYKINKNIKENKKKIIRMIDSLAKLIKILVLIYPFN